jgi:hypothetical protein
LESGKGCFACDLAADPAHGDAKNFWRCLFEQQKSYYICISVELFDLAVEAARSGLHGEEALVAFEIQCDTQKKFLFGFAVTH